MESTDGGLILYAGSSGCTSPSPGSPSSGYQSQSPSSHSQPSSPEEVTFTEIGSLRLRLSGSNTAPSKRAFNFPEDYRSPSAPSSQHPYAHAHANSAERPCAFPGSFSKTGGMVLLCKVCGDIASGFHYGVHACEGCKGFFRRSIQQNINYKMCVKNESCLVMRMNRNRCQHCRFKKCLSVGMSRDAVRFGRIPKREKQRLLDEMQSYMNSLSETATMDGEASPAKDTPLSKAENHSKEAIGAISRAYRDVFVSSGRHQEFQLCALPPSHCPTSPTKNHCLFANTESSRYSCPSSSVLKERLSSTTEQDSSDHGNVMSSAQNNPSYPLAAAPGAKVLACPLNACPISGANCSSQQVWESFSQCFTPAVKEVVEFAKGIPGFQELSQPDQVLLLKAGTFQVLMVRFCTLFNAQEHTVTFLNGQTYPLYTLHGLGMGSLLDSMFDFSEKLGSLVLEPDEMALFMAVVLVSADHSGVADTRAVERLQERLTHTLRSLVASRRPDDGALFHNLLLRLPDLRTLNSLHSDKLLAFHIDP